MTKTWTHSVALRALLTMVNLLVLPALAAADIIYVDADASGKQTGTS